MTRSTSAATTAEVAIRELGRRWAEAEQQGDHDALAALSTSDFTLVGPLGFVLDREQWLDRYRSATLRTTALRWDVLSVREYGSAAVVIGVHTQQATYRGNPADGTFRATHIVVRTEAGWRLAGVHLSPISTAPGFLGQAAEGARPVAEQGAGR